MGERWARHPPPPRPPARRRVGPTTQLGVGVGVNEHVAGAALCSCGARGAAAAEGGGITPRGEWNVPPVEWEAEPAQPPPPGEVGR